jgi:hypothetical protein
VGGRRDLGNDIEWFIGFFLETSRIGLRRMRDIMYFKIIQLSGGLNTENVGSKTNEEDDDANTKNDEFNGAKHLCQAKYWSRDCFICDPKPMEFLGRKGSIGSYHHTPIILLLFQLF